MTDLAQAAIEYAQRGIAVFPLQVRLKKPYGFTAGLLDASADVARATGWWSGKPWPNGAWLPAQPAKEVPGPRRPVRVSAASNIGIATGAPAGFWVLDMDGPEGEASLAALEARHGPLPDTVEQSTGAGRHLCFALPGDGGLPIRNSASKVGPKIDVRGDGGYIVAPPSIHPSGRAYAWKAGHAPGEIEFAAAPGWLLELARPAPETPRAPVKPRVPERGRASRYGEAALSGACGDIRRAAPGTQNSTLHDKAVSIGTLVAGGEIDRSYAEDALIDAGLGMATTKGPWTRAQVEGVITRAFAWAENNPRTAPEMAPRAGSSRAPIDWEEGRKPDPAASGNAAARLWASARPARCAPVLAWFARLGLDADALPGALEGMRAHASAPGANGVRMPCLLVPLKAHPDDGVDALALFDLSKATSRAAGFLGDQAKPRVAMLTNLSPPGPVVVAIDFADAWTLATHAARKGERIRAVAALTTLRFAGGHLGDKWGRIDPDLPMADPARPPWLLPTALFDGAEEVVFALRGDLRTAELRSRKFGGGTMKFRLEGRQAATWYGALAAQAWKGMRPDGLRTRLLSPSGAMSFHDQFRGAA